MSQLPGLPPAPQPNIDIGPYKLANRIAVGGMAEVFRALQPRTAGESRTVVIKRMLPALASELECRQMFEEEGRLGSLIHHKNVVELLDRGFDADMPYIVLEWVFGVDLWRLVRWMRRGGMALRLPLAVYVGTELLEGLSAVHDAQDPDRGAIEIVHRDVSPSNVFLSVHGDVKLGDLGIALAELRDRRTQGAVGARAKGKLGYLSPEQVNGDKLDRRSDVFSAATVIAELLLGKPLFAGGSEIAVLLAIRDANLEPLRAAADRFPTDLILALETALRRNPSDRMATASALRAALLPHLTSSLADLRKELGELVSGALREGGEAGTEDTQSDRAALAATTELRNAAIAAAARDEEFARSISGGAPGGMSPEDSDRAAHERPTIRPAAASRSYEIWTASGKRLGPWPLSRAVEAVLTREAHWNDLVVIDGGIPTPLGEVQELSRHLPVSTRPPPPPKSQRQALQLTSEVYDLAQGGIVAALGRILIASETGLLMCEQGGVRKEIYVRDGVPHFVSSNLASEMLGEYLITEGVVTRGELDLALAVMPRFEGRLGDTLTALGLVEPVKMFRLIARQVRIKLLEIFLWESGQAAFYRGVDPPETGFPLGLDAWDVLDAGLKKRFDRGLGTGQFSPQKGLLLARTAYSRAIVKIPGFPQLARDLLDAVANPQTLDQLYGIRAMTPQDRDAIQRSVAMLLALRALQWQ